MTRQELRDRILLALNESTSSPVFFSTAQMDAVIEEGRELIAEEARTLRRTATISLLPGTTFYRLSGIAADLMTPYRVWAVDRDTRLIPITMGELDRHQEHWLTVTGDPEHWFTLSWDTLGLYPHPAAGGGVLHIDYLAWPTALIDDMDEPEMKDADQDSLILYGVYDGLMKQWQWPRAIELYARFMHAWAKGKFRHGLSEAQARTWQGAEQRPAGGLFPVGMDRP